MLKILLAIVITAFLLTLTGGIIAGPAILSKLGELREENETSEVRIGLVETADIVETVSAPGEVEPRTKVDLSAEVSAKVEQLPFREGDVVRKDDLVVKLDDRDLRAALDAAIARKDGEVSRMQAEQARLAGLVSSKKYTERQLERKQALFDSGDVSSRELDEIQEQAEDLQSTMEVTKYNISVIESSMASADADVARAEEALSKTLLRAPMDGVITALNAEIGEVVLVGTMNNPGTVIMTIADLSRMLVKAQVPESDIAQVADDQSAKVHVIAYRDDVFNGVVTQIALQRTVGSDGTGFFEAEVEMDLAGRQIRSGLAANVDIEIGRHNGLVVEDQAIRDFIVQDLPDKIRRENQLIDRDRRTTQVVFRLIDGKAIITPVRTGASDLTRTLITAGLDEGDQVIIGPYKVLETLEHNMRVKEFDDDGDASTNTSTSSDDADVSENDS